jgi:dihydroxyacetone kinase-like predicted kinase
VDTDVAVAAPRLARRLVRGRLASDKDVNFITVIYGEGISEQDAEAVCENIRGKMARMGVEADVSAIPGGQPVYYYFISVE